MGGGNRENLVLIDVEDDVMLKRAGSWTQGTQAAAGLGGVTWTNDND
jgi:hypothetical protein